MPIFRLLIAIIIVFFYTDVFSQQTNFAVIDSFSINIGKADSLTVQQLTYKLTDRYKDPALKVRSIYTWVAHNISYDCPAFHSEGRRKIEPQDVFKLRKAVCEGYANLFREMCSLANVQCVTIDGFARNGSEPFGEEMKMPNHTWNAVRLDNGWRMVDVTWGSGHTDKKVKQFTQQFSDVYFFPDPYKFVLNHYPKIESWKPAKTRLSQKNFFDNPAIAQGYFMYGLTAFSPQNGIIKTKADKLVRLSFSSSDISSIKSVSVVLGEDKKQVELATEFQVSGNTISLDIAYDKPAVYPLAIYINNLAALRYQFEVE
jgi:hypothetical protein